MTSSITIDTAIAAWKAAKNQIDRDLAAQAIGEHIAFNTPEGADDESATDELLARLKAEFGPVPGEDLLYVLNPQRFYIAVPAELTANEVEAIWGIGRSEEEALADAYHWNSTSAPSVEQDADGKWTVAYDGSRETFPDRAVADAYAATLGYRAEPCTRALYDRVRHEGYDAHGRNSYSFGKNGRLYDVVERDAA
ncbi:hypothetical protein [Methylobacterium sp. 391_Methyba4]|uniref:hypothetical protein n=1 Tax=Methylobacterium sp. 391_Methyba4 TaxID=3038924 RepID=UPI00241E0A4B|nr:hypothetical protein [Methylobacterium sp. 391_Methyba4]WFS10475.1 hypothetical protein P9K36_14845 [Methylobacterium sp. 391_Methyba4]